MRLVTLVLSAIVGLSSLQVWANQYIELDMKLRIQNKEKKSSKESQPTVIAQLGQAAMLTEEHEDGTGFHITVLPQEEKIASLDSAGLPTKSTGLLLKFEVSDIRKGQKIFMGSPQIHVAPGRQARITTRGEDGSIIDLTVTPTLKPDP